jgi:hypothetical protein
MTANWGLPADMDAGPAPLQLAYGSRGGVLGGTGRREDNVLARIYWNHIHDQKASDEAGHPVFVDVPYIEIMIPGNSKDIVNREITDRDKMRFPAVWQAFQENRQGIVQGIPIEEMPLTSRQVAILRHMGVLTVEALAGLGDDKFSMEVTREMRARAQEFLEGGALAAKVAEKDREIDELRARLDQLERALAEQRAERVEHVVHEPIATQRKARNGARPAA